MVISKLHLISFLPPQTLLPYSRSPPRDRPFLPRTPTSTLSLRTRLMIPILVPKFPKTCSTEVVEEEADRKRSQLQHSNDSDVLSVVFPSVAFSNTLFFSSAYNVQVVVGDDEPEDKLVSRFRREVLKAGVIQECKRRRYFETTQEKRKRKIRDAAKRNRRRLVFESLL